MRWRALGAVAGALALAAPAWAADPVAGGAPATTGAPAASSAPSAPPAPGAGSDTVTATCVEHLPEGASRPTLKEEFPRRGLSGYASELRVVVTHGKGETVVPEGFKIQASSEAAKALEKAGFVLPDPTGGVAPTIKVAPGEAGTSVTTLTIPIVTLPPEAGRHEMALPPLPIAIWRANNEFITVCTAPHTIVVEDPLAGTLDARVRPNPPPRPQREDWPMARAVAVAVPTVVVLLLLGAWAYRWWSRRPRVVIAPPKIPPWVSALEELRLIRRSDLLEDGQMDAYYDRVSDTIRRYIGGRYGFEALAQGYNGLETTTGEMLDLLRRVRPPIVELPRIQAFLDDCDLVKFARLTPTKEECVEALERGELIVRRTIPVMLSPGAAGDDRRPPASVEEPS
jgi:hypothetical protein